MSETILMEYIPTGENRVAKVSFLLNVDAHRHNLFEREAELLLQLKNHENIIKLIEYKVSAEYFILVTEYANFGDLEELIEHNRCSCESLKHAVVYSILAQLANAMTFMKKQHVIHRDIKPANVFLHKNGSNQLIVKLGDFGISRLLDESGVASTLIGTLEYVSPEFLNKKPYSYESDAWALGVVLFEMLTLENPFNSPNSLQIMDKIKAGDYKRIRTGVLDFDTWIEGLLETDSSRRTCVEEIVKSPTCSSVLEMLGISFSD